MIPTYTSAILGTGNLVEGERNGERARTGNTLHEIHAELTVTHAIHAHLQSVHLSLLIVDVLRGDGDFACLLGRSGLLIEKCLVGVARLHCQHN